MRCIPPPNILALESFACLVFMSYPSNLGCLAYTMGKIVVMSYIRSSRESFSCQAQFQHLESTMSLLLLLLLLYHAAKGKQESQESSTECGTIESFQGGIQTRGTMRGPRTPHQVRGEAGSGPLRAMQRVPSHPALQPVPAQVLMTSANGLLSLGSTGESWSQFSCRILGEQKCEWNSDY